MLKNRGYISAENHVGLVGYTETDVEGFSDTSSVLTLSAYAYQEALPLVLAELTKSSTSRSNMRASTRLMAPTQWNQPKRDKVLMFTSNP